MTSASAFTRFGYGFLGVACCWGYLNFAGIDSRLVPGWGFTVGTLLLAIALAVFGRLVETSTHKVVRATDAKRAVEKSREASSWTKALAAYDAVLAEFYRNPTEANANKLRDAAAALLQESLK